MLKTVLSIIGLSGIFFFYNEKPKEYPPIESELPLIWKAPIGGASFRTNVLFQNDQIIIGSNGDHFRDFGMIDVNSGVYVIDRKTGKIRKRIAGQIFGDMDVNGVIEFNGNLYFGNDNEEFLCSTPDGKILWRNPTSGDIEHEPVLIKSKEKSYIVYATESGQVSAVDPASGELIWNYYTKGYAGWKPGQNRPVFKVMAFFSNTSSFYTKPQIIDLNKDGIVDLVYLTYEGEVLAINGRNGKLLWEYNSENEYLEFASAIEDVNGNPMMVYFSRVYGENNVVTANIVVINRFGKVQHKNPMNSKFYITSLNCLKIGNGLIMLNESDSILVVNTRGIAYAIPHGQYYQDLDYRKDTVELNRTGGECITAGTVFPFRGHKRCALIQYQHDRAEFQKGLIEIISLDTREVLYRLQLPSGAEMEPVIKDVNKDGKLDVLINCYDGNLYCYSLGK